MGQKESGTTARRSNWSILKEISPWCSLGGLMLKLKLQYFGYLMQTAHSFEKTLMLGKIEGRRRSNRMGKARFSSRKLEIPREHRKDGLK